MSDSSAINRVCIFGGSGFVGQHVIARLATNADLRIRVVTRKPKQHQDSLKYPGLELVSGDPFDPKQMHGLLQDCTAIINLVGILNEAGAGQTFQHLHVDLVQAIINGAKAAGIKRLIHMSGLHANASKGPSRYLYTKGTGEDLAHAQTELAVTSIRPSVIFGPGDSFFNRFAGLLRFAPGVFPLACAHSRFQPVFVGNVAEVIARALEDQTTYGKCYNLCGPKVFSLGELVSYTASLIKRRIQILALNDTLARLQGHVMGQLPGSPFSYDNYLSLQVDSVCNGDDLALLGITATPVESVVPSYIR